MSVCWKRWGFKRRKSAWKLPSESAPYIQYTTSDVIRVRLSFINAFKVLNKRWNPIERLRSWRQGMLLTSNIPHWTLLHWCYRETFPLFHSSSSSSSSYDYSYSSSYCALLTFASTRWLGDGQLAPNKTPRAPWSHLSWARECYYCVSACC